jgi:glutamate decarboxylase
MPLDRHIADLASRFGNRFLLKEVPAERLPDSGMPAVDAMRLIAEELVLDGIRNGTGGLRVT